MKTEDKITSITLLKMVENSEHLGKYSDWMLTATGAISALMLSESGSLLNLMTKDGFVVTMILLICSMIVGVISKIKSIICSTSLRILKTLSNDLNTIIAEHDPQLGDIDFELAIKNASKPLPFFIKWSMLRGYQKGKEDPMYAFYRLTKQYLSQSLWTGVQTLLLLSAFAAATYVVS